ncbi:MAG: sugar phosphate isomerase/epimerase [Clostridiales bacterium]|nr:sugar phosphate isomerase/epimerase [Clostridiales bacterium]
MSKIKLGAQLFTLRDFIQTYEDTEQTFEYLRGIGINVIQISGIGPIEPERVAELVERFSMDVCVTHIKFDRLKNALERLLEEHKMINCPGIGIGSMPGDFPRTKEGFEDFVKEITPIAKKIKAAGLQFGYHNHSFEFERFEDGRTGFDILVEETNPDDFHFILDTHWLQYGGMNPPDVIRNLKGRMEVCHFKDYKIVKNERKFAEVGTGNLNLTECFKACSDCGAGYIVIEQDKCDIDPRKSMAISYENLKAIASKLQ